MVDSVGLLVVDSVGPHVVDSWLAPDTSRKTVTGLFCGLNPSTPSGVSFPVLLSGINQ